MKNLRILYIFLSFLIAFAVLQKAAKNETEKRTAQNIETPTDPLPEQNISYEKQVCEDCTSCCSVAFSKKEKLSRSECFDKITEEIKVPFLPVEMITDIANAICYQDKSAELCSQALCMAPPEE